jgi:hypothetical protein
VSARATFRTTAWSRSQIACSREASPRTDPNRQENIGGVAQGAQFPAPLEGQDAGQVEGPVHRHGGRGGWGTGLRKAPYLTTAALSRFAEAGPRM